MPPPRSRVLFVALVVVALGAPAAGAGSGDVQAIRTVAASYETAVWKGSPKACQTMTPSAQRGFVTAASMVMNTKPTSCAAAVKAIAKKNESLVGNRQEYLRMNNLMLRAIARGKVTVRGTRATLDYTYVDGPVESSSNLLFALVHSHWLIDG